MAEPGHQADNDHEERILTFDWTGAASGPLLFVPASLLPEWSGQDVPEYRTVQAVFRWNDEETRASDYDRACDVDDDVAVLAVGHGQALVLSGVLQATTWVARPWGGLLVRVEHGEDDAMIEQALAALPEALPWTTKGYMTIVSSPAALFNSAEPGVEPVMVRLVIDLAPGEYRVRWARHAPDDRSTLGLVELRRPSS